MRTLAAFCLMVAPATAQGVSPAHCFIRSEPPSSAPVIVTDPSPMDGFGDYLGIALSRTACGLEASAAQAAVLALVGDAGCPPDSEAGLYVLAFVSAAPEGLRKQFMEQFQMDDHSFGAWCGRLAVCEPDDAGDYTDDCYAALKSARE